MCVPRHTILLRHFSLMRRMRPGSRIILKAVNGERFCHLATHNAVWEGGVMTVFWEMNLTCFWDKHTKLLLHQVLAGEICEPSIHLFISNYNLILSVTK